VRFIPPSTAQDLYTELRAAREPTGLSTVYRALRILTDLDLVHEISLDDGTAYRACSPGIHDHLICRRCGTVQESRATRIRTWLGDLRRDGFTADGDRIEVYGICHRCTDLQS
jgi:Fur family ferric uptake transcriptional regulator